MALICKVAPAAGAAVIDFESLRHDDNQIAAPSAICEEDRISPDQHDGRSVAAAICRLGGRGIHRLAHLVQ